MRIDEAFCLTDKQTYTAEEFAKKVAPLRGKSRAMYTKFLVCPYCKISNCEFVRSRNTVYFEMNEDQQHRPGCLYALEEYSQEKIKADIKKNKIAYLENALEMVYGLHQPFPIDYTQKTKTAFIRRVPQKRLETMRKDDFYCYKIFYGKVIVEPHFTETDKFYLLKSKENASVICKIKITDTTFKFLPVEYKLFSPTQPRFICFVGYFKKIYKEDVYGNEPFIEPIHSTVLIHSRLIKIET